MITASEKEILERRKNYLIALLQLNDDSGEVRKINQALSYALAKCPEARHSDNTLLAKHAVEVGITVVEELGLGVNTVVAALLHIVVLNCEYDADEIQKKFGATVRELLEGFKKISRIKVDKPSLYSDNFRNLLLSLVTDIRVILLKLIDRVHMMRSLQGVDEETQKKVCEETFYLYAPLAHRLGLYKLKTELEDNAMKYTYPEMFISITKSLRETKRAREAYIREFIQPLNAELKSHGFKFETKGRSKSIYSIWQKMQKQKVKFDQVYDVFAIRIILDNIIEDEKTDCWSVYSIITNKYEPNPKRLRDWVSVPKKPTGYESLHTTVLGPRKRWVEVQIRTRRMDNVAEKGHAAHWKYKEGSKGTSDEERLKNIREILERPESAELEQSDDARIDLYKDTIFVFTPDGELKKLQAGSTVLDFAYQVHSRVGEQCTGAIVDDKNVPIRYELKNGETVKIITSKNQKPAPDWINYVKSNRTKTKIRRSLRQMQLQHTDAGKATLKRKLNQIKTPFNDEVVNHLLKHFKVKTSQDLYEGIGNQQFDISGLRDILNPETEGEKPVSEEIPVKTSEKSHISSGSEVLLIDNESINDYKMANCCKPIFGDEIFGFVTVGDGVKIHRVNCPNAKQLREKYSYRIIEAKWYEASEASEYLSELKITGEDQLGMVNKITDVISSEVRANMQSINFSSNKGVFTGYVSIHVKDNKVLDSLVYRLRKMPGVEQVLRIR